MIKRKIAGFLAAAIMAVSLPIGAYAADLPSAYWSLNDSYGEALGNKDYAGIAQYGSAVVDLILKEPHNNQNSNIIGSRAYETAFAYYFLGDYKNAVKYFDIYIPYGIEQNWPDGVKIARDFIRQLTSDLQLYKHTSKEQWNFGTKNEPHGVLCGQTSETSRDDESMVLLYLEYNNVSDFNWAGVVMDRAREQGKAVELALNFTREADDVREIDYTAPYRDSLYQFLSNYTDVPVFLRIGAEMNIWGNWAKPEEFKHAFITVGESMRSLPNVSVVWSVAHTGRWQSEQYPYSTDDFYPGDEYVDWVGVNLYPNKYFEGREWYGVEKFNEVCFKTGYSSDPVLMIKDIVDTYGSRKPIMISECGSAYRTNGSINQNHQDWASSKLKEMYAFVPMVYPQVKIMAYFNKLISHEYNYYDLTGAPMLADTYNEVINQPWFVKGARTNAAQTYFERVDNTVNTDGSVTLSVYPHLYGADSITVDYYIDGAFAHSTKTPPYSGTFNDIKGSHTLKIVATGSNGNVIEKEYTLKSQFKANGADDFSDTASLGAPQKAAIDYTVKNGIVTGYDDATFRPSNTITRAEFATMICRMMGYNASSGCTFNDAASHWASPYIAACVNAGAINGVGNNNFAPDDNITFEQAVKIVAVVSGAANGTEQYPDGFIAAAKAKSMLDNMSNTQKGIPLSRADAAVLMYNSVK